MAALGLPLASLSDPWVPPDDPSLRHDLTLLADEGVLPVPMTTWPLSWPDIARHVLEDHSPRERDAATEASLVRVRRAVRSVMHEGTMQWHVRSSVAEKPQVLRNFGDVPREEGELRAGISWTGTRLALRLQVTAASEPIDNKELRGDGSYVGLNLGNFMISVGLMDRWWGPGWEGSLLLSNSARPVPALAIERNYSDPFEVPILRWFGPWRASALFGQLEGSRSDFADTRFFGARLAFKPVPQLEIGLSRTAQWCGEGRPCGGGDFIDLLVGRDNEQAPTEQPGNQLAGYDARWAFRSLPLALYGQMIGEDEAGGLPAKFMGLFGVESWGSSSLGQWRAHAEYADTSCNFSHSTPEFNCAYESGIYTDGYRYRNRSIGHAMDGDGRMYSLGVLVIGDHDDEWQLLLRRVELNRNALVVDARHTIAPVAVELHNAEASYARDTPVGRLRLGIGYDDSDTSGVFRGWIQLLRTF